LTYAEKLTATKQHYPFLKWATNFARGMEQYTPDNCTRAAAIFDTLIAKLTTLGATAPEAQKIDQFEVAVVALNDLNDEEGGSIIETGEREELCELFNLIAEAANIDWKKYGGGEGPASEWRDW
jgi:hypothetical protein